MPHPAIVAGAALLPLATLPSSAGAQQQPQPNQLVIPMNANNALAFVRLGTEAGS